MIRWLTNGKHGAGMANIKSTIPECGALILV